MGVSRAIVMAVLLAAHAAGAAEFEVGPGKQYEAIGDVPIESLAAGDTVLIYWRDTPYNEKFVVGNAGTEAAPITIRGVPGPGGELPIIDGDGATTRPQLSYWNEVRNVIKIGGSDAPADNPSYIVIENLDVRAGHPDHTFRDGSGAQLTYAGNAAAIQIEDGDHITIRNCILRDSANGLFVSPGTSEVLVEGNYFHDNGVTDDIYVHNNYTESSGIVFQYNRFGPLAPGAGGNNLKDRSAGTIIRYNWLEGGNRQLDLVDSEELASLPAFHTTLVYGNVLIEPDGAGNRQLVHYGGDSGTLGDYRKGTLYFYANTVYSERTDRTTLFRLSSSEESVDCRNNVFYMTAGGDTLSLVDQDGDIAWGNNWIQDGWTTSFSGATGTLTELGTIMTGSEPAFVDATGHDFRIAATSMLRDAAGELADGVPAVTEQYISHRQHMARPSDGPPDIGALEFCTDNCAPIGDPDPNDPDAPADPAGCGCRSTSPAAGWPLLLVVLIWRRRSR